MVMTYVSNIIFNMVAFIDFVSNWQSFCSVLGKKITKEHYLTKKRFITLEQKNDDDE